MAQIDNDIRNALTLFNSTLETGIRALVILNAAYPEFFDLNKLTWLDHLVVHTGDIEGPDSLHPTLPQRSGEILVRRRLIEDGLTLMRRLHLITAVSNENGISYQATEEAYAFTGLLRSSYSKELKSRAQWLIENICSMDDLDFHNLVLAKMGRWNIEFQEKNDVSMRSL